MSHTPKLVIPLVSSLAEAMEIKMLSYFQNSESLMDCNLETCSYYREVIKRSENKHNLKYFSYFPFIEQHREMMQGDPLCVHLFCEGLNSRNGAKTKSGVCNLLQVTQEGNRYPKP